MRHMFWLFKKVQPKIQGEVRLRLHLALKRNAVYLPLFVHKRALKLLGLLISSSIFLLFVKTLGKSRVFPKTGMKVLLLESLNFQ